MRGKVQVKLDALRSDGITPAYAGKSRCIADAVLADWDHPRLCGEKHTCPYRYQGLQGSPPPMRGKVLWYRDFCPAVGITPAYAGKRHLTKIFSSAARDHPRLCGEK